MTQTIKQKKEKKVLDLYEQGKTYRDIAQEAHVSPGYISSIIKKSTGEDDKQEAKPISTDTKARILYTQGKTPLEVSNDLSLTVEEVERIYTDFWKLKGFYDLYNTYVREIINNIPSFLKLYEIMKDKEISEKQILKTLENSDKLLSLDALVEMQARKLESSVARNRRLNAENEELLHNKQHSKNLCQLYRTELERLTNLLKFKFAQL